MMKKLFIGAGLLLGLTLPAHAAHVSSDDDLSSSTSSSRWDLNLAALDFDDLLDSQLGDLASTSATTPRITQQEFAQAQDIIRRKLTYLNILDNPASPYKVCDTHFPTPPTKTQCEDCEKRKEHFEILQRIYDHSSTRVGYLTEKEKTAIRSVLDNTDEYLEPREKRFATDPADHAQRMSQAKECDEALQKLPIIADDQPCHHGATASTCTDGNCFEAKVYARRQALLTYLRVLYCRRNVPNLTQAQHDLLTPLTRGQDELVQRPEKIQRLTELLEPLVTHGTIVKAIDGTYGIACSFSSVERYNKVEALCHIHAHEYAAWQESLGARIVPIKTPSPKKHWFAEEVIKAGSIDAELPIEPIAPIQALLNDLYTSTDHLDDSTFRETLQDRITLLDRKTMLWEGQNGSSSSSSSSYPDDSSSDDSDPDNSSDDDDIESDIPVISADDEKVIESMLAGKDPVVAAAYEIIALDKQYSAVNATASGRDPKYSRTDANGDFVYTDACEHQDDVATCTEPNCFERKYHARIAVLRKKIDLITGKPNTPALTPEEQALLNTIAQETAEIVTLTEVHNPAIIYGQSAQQNACEKAYKLAVERYAEDVLGKTDADYQAQQFGLPYKKAEKLTAEEHELVANALSERKQFEAEHQRILGAAHPAASTRGSEPTGTRTTSTQQQESISSRTPGSPQPETGSATGTKPNAGTQQQTQQSGRAPERQPERGSTPGTSTQSNPSDTGNSGTGSSSTNSNPHGSSNPAHAQPAAPTATSWGRIALRTGYGASAVGALTLAYNAYNQTYKTVRTQYRDLSDQEVSVQARKLWWKKLCTTQRGILLLAALAGTGAMVDIGLALTEK